MKKIVYSCLMVILLVSCDASFEPGYIEDDEKAVETEIENFHKSFNSVYRSKS